MDLLYWSRHFRNMPGQGDLPINDFMTYLNHTGYDGYLSLEIFTFCLLLVTFGQFGYYIYIIIMKHLTFILLLALFSAPKFSDAKSCSIAPPENYTLCEYDSQGECCLIEYEEDGQDCIEVVCTSWDQCAWEPALKKQCG